MGSMIAVKLASLAPQRCLSMTAISTTGGGWQSIPMNLRALKLVLQSLRGKGELAEHKLALKFHFTKEMLDEIEHDADVGTRKRKVILLQEYSTMSRSIGPNSEHGKKGQLRAVWTHRVTRNDIMTIRHARVPCLVIHGRHDIVAAPKWGQKLAENLKCPLMLLEGAHFLTRDQSVAVNELIIGVVFGKAFHHAPHYQFVLSDSHLPGSYVEELDTSIRDLDELQHMSNSANATNTVPLNGRSNSGSLGPPEGPPGAVPRVSENPVALWSGVANGSADSKQPLKGQGSSPKKFSSLFSKFSSRKVA